MTQELLQEVLVLLELFESSTDGENLKEFLSFLMNHRVTKVGKTSKVIT